MTKQQNLLANFKAAAILLTASLAAACSNPKTSLDCAKTVISHEQTVNWQDNSNPKAQYTVQQISDGEFVAKNRKSDTEEISIHNYGGSIATVTYNENGVATTINIEPLASDPNALVIHKPDPYRADVVDIASKYSSCQGLRPVVVSPQTLSFK